MAHDSRLDAASDAELLQDARRSSAAFSILYDRHAARIHAFHLRRSRDRGAAVELTAETFAQAWLSRDRYTDHGEGTIAPWLFGIAHHVLAASVRRRSLDRAALDRLRLDLEPMTVEIDSSWLDGLDTDLSTALADCPTASVERSSFASSPIRPTTTSGASSIARQRPPASASTAASSRSDGA